MMRGPIIRAFEEEDRTAIIELWERCSLTRPWNDPSTDIDLAVGAENAARFVTTLDEGILASVMVGFDGHRGWVYYLAVAPRRRGEGNGRAMMAHAEQCLKARGAPKIQLMVRGDNEAARGFYAALGYAFQDVVVIGRRLDKDD